MSRNAARLPATVRQAAEQVVGDHVDIDAVLLFGSRARGDHRPDSDIDLAVVGRGCPHSAERALRNADRRVETIYVTSAKELRANANLATAIEAALVRQAVRIAGTWRRPSHRKENLDVSTLDLANNLTAASRELHAALRLTAAALNDEALRDAQATTHTFNAAERLGKALLWSFGETPKSVHNLAMLADQLDGDTTKPDTQRDARADIAAQLRAMNGFGRIGHLATYDAAPIFEITETTAERVGRVAALQAQTLRRIARHPESRGSEPDDEQWGLTRLKHCARTNLTDAADTLNRNVPDELRDSVLAWLHAAMDADQTLGEQLAEEQHPDAPDARASAKRAAAAQTRNIAGKWANERPQGETQRREVPQSPRTSARRTPQERFALAITRARVETRHCIDPDRTSTRAMSIPSWRDLKHEAKQYLNSAKPGTGHVEQLAKRLLGKAPATSADWTNAADHLEHRARLVDATTDASKLHRRATEARRALGPGSAAELETCATIAALTKPVGSAKTTADRETVLAAMGPGLNPGERKHVEHVMDLVPKLDWRLERIEARLGLLQHTGPERGRGQV